MRVLNYKSRIPMEKTDRFRVKNLKDPTKNRIADFEYKIIIYQCMVKNKHFQQT